jgi:DNA-binding transcriptional MerR regulator
MHRSLRTFSIQEVSQRLSLTKHTLRYWEKEIEGVLRPLRSDGGQRRYTEEHVFVIKEIKRLKSSGLSLADIKGKLAVGHGAERPNTKVDELVDRIAEIVRAVIYDFLEDKRPDQEMSPDSTPVRN